MSRNLNARFVKPMLENLEERALPSFLLGGNAVQQLATPLNNMVTDMQSASADLKAQFTLLKNNTPPANTFAGAEKIETIMVSDFQRILTDQAAIKALSAIDVTVLNSIATSEFIEGDPTDLIILDFGGIFGFHPLTPLTTPVTNAANVVNDTTLQTDVSTNLHTINTFIDSTTPINQVTFTPSFT